MSISKRVLAMVASVAIITSGFLTACGSDEQAKPQPQVAASEGQLSADLSGGASCMQVLSPEDKAKMQSYIKQNNDEYQTVVNQTDGTEKLCIIETAADGTTSQRYVDRQEMDSDESHLGEYLMYSMLFGHSNALIGYGLISNDLDFMDAMALSMLMGVNSSGGLYQPYRYTDRGWGYEPYYPDRYRNVKVTNVYYGGSGSKPVAFRDAKPPVNYRTANLPTATPQKVAEMTPSGPKVKQGVSASTVLKTAKPTTVKIAAPAKRTAPAPNYSRPKPAPAPSPTASKPAPAPTRTSVTQAPAPSTTVKPTPTQSAPKSSTRSTPKSTPKPKSAPPKTRSSSKTRSK